ncbi:hypothetical protein Dip510_001035 [Elusimicrobium posterum]|uniref:hypothetical protein n=1 Tax=Elusimicrobium posterum TaxID=3116653 RepID=UPI003C759476
MKKVTVLLFACALFAVACRSSQVMNTSSLVSGKTASQVEKAIFKGCAERGWQCAKTSDGVVTGILKVRHHVAEIEIPYSANKYEIIYKDSANLDYSAKGNKIHSQYNNWASNLDRSIYKNLYAAN